jgi:hypothetical protein
MKHIRDVWYIRLPSGQELKAKTTKAVLHHVNHGVIPRNSLVRRAPDQEWQTLEWTAEFTEALKARETRMESNGSRPDMGPLAGIASRLDPLRLRTVGVRGIWEDLLAALDSTFVRPKLVAAALTTALIGLFLVIVPWLVVRLQGSLGWSSGWSPGLVREVTGFAGLLMLGGLNGLLARMTYIELSNMRRCRPGEALRGFFSLELRLVIAYFLIVAGLALISALMRSLPAVLPVTLADSGAPAWLAATAHNGVTALGTAIEVALWFALGLTGLLAPVMVVEECSIFTALVSWCRLLRRHPGRILLAEALAIMVGVLITLPFAAPVFLALQGREFVPSLGADAVKFAAWGLAFTPLAAFLAVANVFVYLDVRYEQNG